MTSVLRDDLQFLALMLLLGAVLRLDYLWSSNFVIDSDEAIVGLMAKHILEGAPLPVFYYGQHYMGSLEPFMVAALSALFGVNSITLKLVPFFWSLVLLPLTYLVGFFSAVRAPRFCGRIAALLIAVPPAALVEWSGKARGGFIELVCIGTLTLLLTIKWCGSASLTLQRTSVLGLLLGLGWWTNNQIIFFVLPIGLYLLNFLRKKSLVRVVQHFTCGMATFLLGGLPFWWHNLINHFVSFKMFGGTSDLSAHLAGLFAEALPIIMGARRFWHEEELAPGATIAVGLLYGALLVVLLTQRANDLRQFCRGKVTQRSSVVLLLLFVVTCCGVFTLSSFGSLFRAPRYLLPLYPALFVLVALALEQFPSRGRMLLVPSIAALLAVHTASMYLGGRAVSGEPHVFKGERVSADMTELEKWLLKNHIKWVRTNYWIGYRLSFEMQERVRFVLFGEPFQPRINSYEVEGQQQPLQSTPLVLTGAQGSVVKQALRAMGYRFEEVERSSYVVLYDVAPLVTDKLHAIESSEVMVSASQHPETAQAAFDKNYQTRWGTGEPQKPGMTFRLSFEPSRPIRELHYSLGTWNTDFPRGLEIVCENRSTRHLMLSSADYEAVRYWTKASRARHDLELFFAPAHNCETIDFVQTARDEVFDWSVAEIEIYE